MKYYLGQSKDYGLSVSIQEGTEEERQRVCVLAESLFGTRKNQIRVVENYTSHLFYLRDLRQFKRLIKWKSLFDSWSPNKGFSFRPSARNAIKIAREVLNNQVFAKDGIDEDPKD